MTNTISGDATTVLVYDGECPVCSAYVRFVRFRESVGDVALVNARDGGEIVETILAQNLDLNEGMVLWYGGRFYHGSDCIHMLAILSGESGTLNRLNAVIFRQPTLAKVLYPLLRFGRNSLLWILGRSKLELE